MGATSLLNVGTAPEAFIASSPVAIAIENFIVQDKLFAVIRAGGDRNKVEKKLRAVIRQYAAQAPEGQRKAIGDLRAFENTQVSAMMLPGLRSILLSDPAKTLTVGVSCARLER